MQAWSPISLNLIRLMKPLLPSELVPSLRALALHHPFLHRRRGLIHPGSEGFSAAGLKQASHIRMWFRLRARSWLAVATPGLGFPHPWSMPGKSPVALSALRDAQVLSLPAHAARGAGQGERCC